MYRSFPIHSSGKQYLSISSNIRYLMKQSTYQALSGFAMPIEIIPLRATKSTIGHHLFSYANRLSGYYPYICFYFRYSYSNPAHKSSLQSIAVQISENSIHFMVFSAYLYSLDSQRNQLSIEFHKRNVSTLLKRKYLHQPAQIV